MNQVRHSGFLGLLAIFKNESAILAEWIDHYIAEGVDHFFLINNGSTDNFHDELTPFIKKNIITVINDDSRWVQVELYNKYFEKYSKNFEWFILCDLDEFIYSRRKYSTIKQFLSSLSRKTGMVQIPWKMFGSSGYKDQPANVVKSFIKRANYNGHKKATMLDKKQIFCKSIIRTSCVENLHVHFSSIGRYQCVSADKKKRKIISEYLPINEKILKKSYLHLNHYPIQSFNWFMAVKSKRGDVNSEKYDDFRDIYYFKKYDSDSNELIDDELALKHKL